MDRAKAVGKVKKLMALADDNSNVHESAIARSQANKLCRRYDITVNEWNPEELNWVKWKPIHFTA